MWLLLLIILIMPFEMSPYLYISPSFLGISPDFTVIKLLGMLGFAWAVFKIVMLNRRGRGGERVFESLPAQLFGAMFTGVVVSAILNESPMFAITKYLVFDFFLPFVLVLALLLTSSRGGFLGLLVAASCTRIAASACGARSSPASC